MRASSQSFGRKCVVKGQCRATFVSLMLKKISARRAFERTFHSPQLRCWSGALAVSFAAGALLGGCGGGGSGPSSGNTNPQNARETLVFQSNRSGNFEVYSAFGDGKVQLRLTNDPESDIDPVLSPDRRHIAFSSRRSGKSKLYLMNADGTGVKRLTDSALSEVQPAWSPDGTRLAFQSVDEENFSSDVAIVDVANGKQHKLTNEGAFLTNSDPAWSPDGTRIVYSSSYDPTGEFASLPQIYVRSVAGGEPKAITTDLAVHTAPAWSPDGSQLAFVSDADGDPEIFVSRPDGSAVRQVTKNNWRDEVPVWSRDGKRLIFSSNPNDNFDLYSLTLSNGALTRLTTDPGFDDAPDVR